MSGHLSWSLPSLTASSNMLMHQPRCPSGDGSARGHHGGPCSRPPAPRPSCGFLLAAALRAEGPLHTGRQGGFLVLSGGLYFRPSLCGMKTDIFFLS